MGFVTIYLGRRLIMAKTGRPLVGDKALTYTVKARVDADTYAALLEYCKENKITITDTLRTAIYCLLEEKEGR
jgi:hypothetical protein